MRAFSNVMAIICMAAMLWGGFSYVDVLSHNDPLTGDRNYSQFNAIVILEEVAR